MLRLAVIGAGGWGRNLIRNYYQIPHAHLAYICDLNETTLAEMAQEYPGVKTTKKVDDVLHDPDVSAVIIATLAPTHFELCRSALFADKDVYVEKPFVLRSEDAEKLIELAEERQRILMVGHLLEYHPVVRRLKEMIDSGELGRILYVYSQRLNLGTVREDENALWNFAPHDVSVILYLLGGQPTDVSARGQCYLQSKIEDVVFMSLNFSNTVLAHIHVSWLDPHKTRKLTIVGTKKMAVFDDLEPNEKLKVYDKGVQVRSDYDSFAEYVGLRFGDITVPYIRVAEPLRIECEHFIQCVTERSPPVSDGRDGLRVVRVLERAQQSLDKNGAPVSF